jgi:thiamine transporter
MRITTRDIVGVAIAAALATALSFLRLFELPQGGSITLELLPVFYIAFRHGAIHGIAAGTISGILQLILRPFIVHPVQVLLDYPLAMAAAGVAGVFRSLDSQRGLRNGMAMALGMTLLIIAMSGWTQLERIRSTGTTVLAQNDDWQTVVVLSPDTASGDVEARLLTIHLRSDGDADTVSVTTVHGETAQTWMQQSASLRTNQYADWFAGVTVSVLALAGLAVLARYLSAGPVALGVMVGGALVFLSHFAAGVVFFAAYTPAGQSVWLYSAIYNAVYVVPQVALSLMILPPLLRRAGIIAAEDGQT